MKSSLVLSVMLIICAFACSPGTPESTKLPNIVLVMADDQGWGDMGYNGHPVIQTPNFDRMAVEALRFDRFYAAAPVCSPTRGSVMTGRHPNRFGCFSWGNTLRPQEITIAERLKEAGYITGHFGKWHLGSVRKGSPVNPGESGFDEWYSAPNFFDNNPVLSREGIAIPTEGESSMVTVDAALEFIQKHQGGDQPYFAVVWFGSPHSPHEAIQEDQNLYADQPDNLRHFYGEISGMDRAFGKLRNYLRTLGNYDNTILWYNSDNGGLPRIGATGGRGKKADVYEGGLRVPAILEWPAKISAPATTKFPASTSDIFPTLLEIVGLTPDQGRPLDGISLLPLIEGTNMQQRTMGFWQYPGRGIRTPSKEWMAELLEAQQAGNMTGDSTRLRLEAGILDKHYSSDSLPGHAALLEWPYKLHRIPHQTDSITWELYDLARDSMETTNLLTEFPERVASMKSSLHTWQQSVVASLNGEDYD